MLKRNALCLYVDRLAALCPGKSVNVLPIAGTKAEPVIGSAFCQQEVTCLLDGLSDFLCMERPRLFLCPEEETKINLALCVLFLLTDTISVTWVPK